MMLPWVTGHSEESSGRCQGLGILNRHTRRYYVTCLRRNGIVAEALHICVERA